MARTTDLEGGIDRQIRAGARAKAKVLLVGEPGPISNRVQGWRALPLGDAAQCLAADRGDASAQLRGPITVKSTRSFISRKALW